MPFNFPDMQTKVPENEIVLRKGGQQNKSSTRMSLLHGFFPLENIQEWHLEKGEAVLALEKCMVVTDNQSMKNKGNHVFN